ncbi:MAG: fumarylacetoacetate hydrolase family protein [Rhodobacteraceae bacterium]|jgi:2-keto-4-pentenoate hydratase/2-oxohepta-3-ene-1,7-dioic acid hydratase in catechol pathway|nr:fumarylacetoacetate hydrolase family protein [Paracoccaceae bacterium]
MRIASIQHGGTVRLAIVDDGCFRVAPAAITDLRDVMAPGDGLRAFAEACHAGDTFVFDPSLLRAPLLRIQRDILCAGWNYWDHFEEGRGRREGQEVDRPQRPTFFTKGPDAVVGPQDPIAFDAAVSTRWDYEVEVAVIIGRDGRSIPPERALDHVFGYCLANDISLRDLQRAHGGQWLKGKSIDRTMPLGPWITTADAVDPAAIDIACEVNGELLQSASTALMAFDLPTLIAELSWGMTLRAGDVLLTGTPAGVGNARTPPRYLSEGDVVISRSPQLGEMRNRMTSVDLHSYEAGSAAGTM